MEDEEDDFYDPTDSVTAAQTLNDTQNAAQTQPQEGDDMDEEEVEVEDDEVGRSSYFSTPFAKITRMISTSSQRLLPMRQFQKCKQTYPRAIDTG